MQENQKSLVIRLIAQKLIEKGLDVPGIILELSVLLTEKYPTYFSSPFGEKHVSLNVYLFLKI